MSLYLSEDSNSHQSFPSAPLKAAMFIERHKAFLNIQLCNLTGRTQSIFQLELRSDDGARLLKRDAVSVSL